MGPRLSNPEEIDRAIRNLRVRIQDVEALALGQVSFDDMRVQNVIGNIRRTILEAFGGGSEEYQRHFHHEIWDGPHSVSISESAKQRAFQAGIPRTIAMLDGLVADLESRRQLLGSPSKPVGRPFDGVGMHPAIRTAAEALYESRHYAQAVFEAGKVLVNLVKQKTGRFDLDGADLMLKAFRPEKPLLTFNPMRTETETGEQQGLMFLFAGVVLALRNPRAHDTVVDSGDEARDYLLTISRLAHRLDGAVLVDGELHLWIDYQGPNEDEIERVGAEVWFTTPGGGREGRLVKRYGANQMTLLTYDLRALKCQAVDAELDGWPGLVDFNVRCTLSWAGLRQLGLLPT